MPQYGYTTAGGEEISPFIDMINGGGPGRSGEQFEGGGILSLLANLVASPYGSQRQRPGHPAPGTMGISRDASGGGFQSQLPGEDLMGGMGDAGEDVVPPAIAGDTDMRRTTPYTDEVPLSEADAALLLTLDANLVPPELSERLPGELVPESAVAELRSLVRDGAPPSPAAPAATRSITTPPVTTVVDLPVPGSDTPPTLSRVPPAVAGDTDMRRTTPHTAFSRFTGAGLGQGMASPMATGEGLGLIGDQTYSGRPAPYTMASESFPMPTQNLSVYEMSEIAALMDVLRNQNPTASEEEIQRMAVEEIVSRR